MKRLTALLYASALALLLWAGTEAKAGIDWGYDFSPVPIGPSFTLWSDNNNSSITMNNQPLYGAVGNSDVIAAHLGVNSTTGDSSPDGFTHVPYTLNFFLKDTASGANTTLMFAGDISGLVSAHSSNTSNVFHSPTSFLGIHLGHNIYDVFIGPYTGPGPGGGLTGSIGAHVNVKPEGGDHGNPTPEPSSLLLSCLGLSFAGLSAWRKRRNKGLELVVTA